MLPTKRSWSSSSITYPTFPPRSQGPCFVLRRVTRSTASSWIVTFEASTKAREKARERPRVEAGEAKARLLIANSPLAALPQVTLTQPLLAPPPRQDPWPPRGQGESLVTVRHSAPSARGSLNPVSLAPRPITWLLRLLVVTDSIRRINISPRNFPCFSETGFRMPAPRPSFHIPCHICGRHTCTHLR